MQFLYQFAFFALVVVSCVHSKSITQYTNCKDEHDEPVSKVTKLEVDPCSTEPCKIKRGTSVALKVTFTAMINATDVKSKVFGYIGSAKVPFPLDNPEACTGCGLKCPLTSDKSYVFNSTLPVKSIYPQIKLVAEWQLVDKNDKFEFCFQVPLQLV